LNTQEIINEVSTSVNTVINQTVTNRSVSEILTQLDYNQENQLIIDGSEIGEVAISNSIQFDIATNQIVKRVSENIANTNILNELSDDITNELEEERTGISSVVNSLSSFFSKYWIFIIIFVIILIIGIVIVVFFVFRSKTTETFVNNITNPDTIRTIGETTSSGISNITNTASKLL
jgi:ATP-dependent Zn protease